MENPRSRHQKLPQPPRGVGLRLTDSARPLTSTLDLAEGTGPPESTRGRANLDHQPDHTHAHTYGSRCPWMPGGAFLLTTLEVSSLSPRSTLHGEVRTDRQTSVRPTNGDSSPCAHRVAGVC